MTVLVDTSVWVDYLAGRAAVRQDLDDLLDANDVLMHEMVIGELAMGNMRERARTLARLGQLRRGRTATNDEVMKLVEARRLHGRGIGWLDAHLLASAMLDTGKLWTNDARLSNAAEKLGVGWER